MKIKSIFPLMLCLTLLLLGMGTLYAKGGGNKAVCDHPCYVKHLKMAGGDCEKCLDCHCKLDQHDKCGQAFAPQPLKGRYANMGGPNHSCYDCHNGVKAALLPAYTCLSELGSSCADCHK